MFVMQMPIFLIIAFIILSIRKGWRYGNSLKGILVPIAMFIILFWAIYAICGWTFTVKWGFMQNNTIFPREKELGNISLSPYLNTLIVLNFILLYWALWFHQRKTNTILIVGSFLLSIIVWIPLLWSNILIFILIIWLWLYILYPWDKDWTKENIQ